MVISGSRRIWKSATPTDGSRLSRRTGLRRAFSTWVSGIYFHLKIVLRDPSNRVALCIFLLSFLIYVLYASFRHFAFRTYDFDLGIYSQSLSSTLQGRFLYSTVNSWYSQTGSLLAEHFSPIILLLVPLYAVFPTPETLLAVQALAISGAAVPLYLLSRKATGSPSVGCALALIWVLNPATQSLAWYDFHIEAFLPFFAFLGFYYVEARSWAKALSAFMLGNITIELSPIIFVFAGLYLGVAAVLPRFRKRPTDSGLLRFSFLLILESAASLVAADWVISYYGPRGIAGTRSWSILGSGLYGVLTGILDPGATSVALNTDFPNKVFFFLVLILPFTIVLLIEPLSLVMQTPLLLAASLASLPGLYTLGFQYAGAFALPFLLVGLLKGLRRLPIGAFKVTLRTVLVWSIILGVALSPLNTLTSSVPPLGTAYNRNMVDQHTVLLHQALSLVPATASLLVQKDIFAHFSNRVDAYSWLPRGFIPEFIVADTKLPLYESPVAGLTMADSIQRLRKNYTYGFLVDTDGIVVLAKGYTGRPVMYGEYNATFDYRNFQLLSGVLQRDSTSNTGIVAVHAWYDNPGPVWFGPNIGLPPGNYTVKFTVKPQTDNETLRFVVLAGQVFLVDKHVPPTSLQPFAWQTVSLNFTEQGFLDGYQFQVYSPNGGLWVDRVELQGALTS